MRSKFFTRVSHTCSSDVYSLLSVSLVCQRYEQSLFTFYMILMTLDLVNYIQQLFWFILANINLGMFIFNKMTFTLYSVLV